MNKVEKEKFTDRTMKQKYNIIHFVQGLGEPELAGAYVKNFFNAAKRYRLALPDSIVEDEGKFCQKCGTVRVVNHNTSMELLREEKDGVIVRKLRYVCYHCNQECVTKVDEFEKEPPQSSEKSSLFVAEWPKKSKDTVDSSNKNMSAKERAKKRKQSTLSNLLSAKKEQNERKNKTSLSLMDFMK